IKRTTALQASTRCNLWRFVDFAHRKAQARRKGNTAPRAGLVSSDIPQSRPYTANANTVGRSGRTRVAQSNTAARNAESEVSQIHAYGKIIATGARAHSQQASTAVNFPHTRSPAENSGKQARAENNEFTNTAAQKEPNVNVPNNLNTAASRKG